MLYITKKTKVELISHVRSLEKEFANYKKAAEADVMNARNEAQSQRSLFKDFKEKFESEIEKSQGFSNQLSDVRKAIQTVLRMKYPNKNISMSDDMSKMLKSDIDEVPVNEELNLLNYLQDLAQIPMTASDLRGPYGL